jgi:hypothetical protein
VTRIKGPITATLAALFIGGLSISHVSAAQHWSDISSVTHGAVVTETKQQQFGRLDNFYKWSDKAARSNQRIGTGVAPMAQTSDKPGNWSDLTSVTHN